MNTVLNISAYRFVELQDAEQLRQEIQSQALQLGLRGTVLLATEGINLFLAGPHDSVRSFLKWLRQDLRFASIEAKESESAEVPFGKLLVKVKPEIIRMDLPQIQPQARRAPAVNAATLARWLDQGKDDEGREVVLLDTRNDFEVDHGRFQNTLDWRLQKFSDFPQALEEKAGELSGKTVVSYCTGGIRCEKAALLMEAKGIAHVLQLEGGILRYFEEVGGKHFEGNCFVFDDRRLVDSTLAAVSAQDGSR